MVFEYRASATGARRNFIAVARGDEADNLTPTGAAKMTDADLREAERQFGLLSALEERLVGHSVLDVRGPACAMEAIGAAGQAMVDNEVLTYCLYLELQRQLAVLEASVRDYESRAVRERVAPTLAASIYESLLLVDERARARVLLDQDRVVFPDEPEGPDWGHALDIASAVCERGGDVAAALVYIQSSVAARPSAPHHRRMARLFHQNGEVDKAIQALRDAHSLEELNGHQARQLAWWCVEAGQIALARRWKDYAHDRGVVDMPVLEAQLTRLEGEASE